jgi:L-2-hydroxyglutarate oxidase LhgO
MPAAKVGIRPQLINIHDKKLMMDFLVVKQKHSLHILNAISPAFTSSLAFAKYIVQHYYNA